MQKYLVDILQIKDFFVDLGDAAKIYLVIGFLLSYIASSKLAKKLVPQSIMRSKSEPKQFVANSISRLISALYRKK